MRSRLSACWRRCPPPARRIFALRMRARRRIVDVARLKPGTIAFSDGAGSAAGAANLIAFAEWARTRPGAEEIPVAISRLFRADRHQGGERRRPRRAGPRKAQHVCRAGALCSRPRAGCDRPVALRDAAFPGKDRSGDQAQADRRRRHRSRSPTMQGTGNANPDRKWCTGRATLDLHPVELQARRQDSDRRHAGQQVARQRQEGLRPHRFPERVVGAFGRRRRSGRVEGADRRSIRRSPACSSRTFSTSTRS